MNENKAPSNTTQPLVRDAFNLLKQIGHPVEGSPFEQSLAKLQNATYKIAFVGRFQVGKSTLINRAFIKDAALLTSGEGLPTTAVATELKFGETPRLEVFNWNLTGESIPTSDQLEVSAKVVENPSSDDMARETANDDPTSRTELARKLARVVLEWPSESLKRYTLLDTPGIDDPDEVLLANTTYRLLPECDLTVLVVPAAQLSKIETDFLRQKLFDQGFTRLLVLVSHHADTQPRSSAMLARILASIRGQLDSIGRANVPVQMFCYDEAAEGDLLKTPAQIESAVLQFANEQAQPARIEKAVHLGLQELHQAGNKLQAEIAANGKTEEERATMLANARKDIAAINRRYDQLMDSLRPRVRAARDTYIDNIVTGLHGVNADFDKGFNANGLSPSGAYDAAAKHIREAGKFLDPKIQSVVAECMANFDTTLRAHTNKFCTDLRFVLDAVGTERLDLTEQSFLTRSMQKIGGPTVAAVEFALLGLIIIPGGLAVNYVFSVVLDKVLERLRIIPTELARQSMVSSAKKDVTAALLTLQEKVIDRITADSIQVEEQIREAFLGLMDREIKPWEIALQQAPVHYNTQCTMAQLAEIESFEQHLNNFVAA